MKGDPFIPSTHGLEVQIRCDSCGRVLIVNRDELRKWLDAPDSVELRVKES